MRGANPASRQAVSIAPGRGAAPTIQPSSRSCLSETTGRAARTCRRGRATKKLDHVFDTVGGEVLARSAALLRDGGRIVSVAEEPPPALAEKAEVTYFVVEPNREQLVELARLVDDSIVRPAIDSVFPLAEARSAFERSMMPGKRGKVVLRIGDERHASR